MKRRESDSFLMLFLKLRGGINVYYKNNTQLYTLMHQSHKNKSRTQIQT